MFWKKNPVLTATFCKELEKLRTAVEVLTGKRARLRQLDLDTCKGKVSLGENEFDIMFFSAREELFEFKLDGAWNRLPGWNIATFENDGKTQVINRDYPRMIKNVIKMRWVGYSATDRWEEPLFMKEIEEDAKRRNLSLQEHLRSLNIPVPPPRYFRQLKPGDTFIAGNIRWIAVASAQGGKFAVSLEGDERGRIVHLS